MVVLCHLVKLVILVRPSLTDSWVGKKSRPYRPVAMDLYSWYVQPRWVSLWIRVPRLGCSRLVTLMVTLGQVMEIVNWSSSLTMWMSSCLSSATRSRFRTWISWLDQWLIYRWELYHFPWCRLMPIHRMLTMKRSRRSCRTLGRQWTKLQAHCSTTCKK